MTTFLSVFKQAANILKNDKQYDLIERANGDKITTKPGQTYVFDVQSAVSAGRFSSIMLELFTERGYLTKGGIVVCPASIKVLEINVVLPDNKMGVIPVLNIPDIMANPDLRALIINAPIEFLT